MPRAVQRATAADVPYSMSSGCATTQRTRWKDSSGRAGNAMSAILPELFPAGDGQAGQDIAGERTAVGGAPELHEPTVPSQRIWSSSSALTCTGPDSMRQAERGCLIESGPRRQDVPT